MEACPTAAIVEPYTVDAGKCLSYWTIEAKPEISIPSEISQNMEQWIFGCDICQDVCPWNSFSKETTIAEFHPRHGQTTLLLNDIMSMEQSEFSDRFRKSPLKRTKLAGLQRNVEALLHAQKDTDEHI
jgi:epoxyqueuosine reductase